MRKIVFPLVLAGLMTFSTSYYAEAQSLADILNTLSGGNSKTTGGQSSGKGLSNTDIAKGLKEALSIGAKNASNKLSATDGFFKNAAIKILLPPEARQVEQSLRAIGMGSMVDKAILSMNRAAEDAAKQAAPIFLNAITSMSIQDGLNILQGGNNAATNFLKAKTTSSLTAAFSPVIKKSLDKVGAVGLWKTVFSTYNNLPLSQKKVNPDMTAYVTERALNGMFVSIAEEEAKIRTDPAAQVTNILRQVFGK